MEKYVLSPTVSILLELGSEGVGKSGEQGGGVGWGGSGQSKQFRKMSN